MFFGIKNREHILLEVLKTFSFIQNSVFHGKILVH